MTAPTNFYTQAPSLLPQGLQSLISGGQLGPNGPTTVPQQATPQLPYMQSPMPMNWNQVVQQETPIYQTPAQPASPVMQSPIVPPPMTQPSPIKPVGQSFGAGVMPAYGTLSHVMVR